MDFNRSTLKNGFVLLTDVVFLHSGKYTVEIYYFCIVLQNLSTVYIAGAIQHEFYCYWILSQAITIYLSSCLSYERNLSTN